MALISALVLCLGVAVAGPESVDVQTESTDISGRAYFPAVHRELQAATESIHVVMYLMKLYPSSTSASPTFVLVHDLIDAHDCVAAYLNGHNHAGNYAIRNGVHYLTLHGMVETPDTTASAVINVQEDSLIVHGTGREPTRTLTLR